MSDIEAMGVVLRRQHELDDTTTVHVEQGDAYLGRVWKSIIDPTSWCGAAHDPQMQGGSVDYPPCVMVGYFASKEEAVRQVIVATDRIRDGEKITSGIITLPM